MSFSVPKKVFPLHLPKNYHGEQKPLKRLSQIYSDKISERPHANPEQYPVSRKISNWQRKRLDRDVTTERKQFLVHPAKLSVDTPDWFRTTYHHFHRSLAPVRKHQPIYVQREYDVFNQHKLSKYASTPSPSMEKTMRFRQTQAPVTQKIGTCSQFYTRTNAGWNRQVTPKIGSVDIRDYTVRKPQMKIGITHGHNFIDTYSVN